MAEQLSATLEKKNVKKIIEFPPYHRPILEDGSEKIIKDWNDVICNPELISRAEIINSPKRKL